MIAAVALLLVALTVLAKFADFGASARRQRDAALDALRELVAARTARGLDAGSSAREARAWARAIAVVRAHEQTFAARHAHIPPPMERERRAR
jgi:hypothetical protein